MSLHIPPERRIEITKFAAEELDTLYQLVDLYRSADTSVGHMPGHEISRTEAFLREIDGRLKAKICDEWEYCKKRNDPDLQDNVSLIACVADLIATFTIGIPPTLIATILVKKGLTQYCRCSEESHKENNIKSRAP